MEPIQIDTEARMRESLTGMAQLAANELALGGGHNASVTLTLLRLLIDTLKAAQQLNQGGVPERTNSTRKPHHPNTHHNDGATAQTVIGLLELAAFCDDTGGKLAVVVPPDEPRAMARAVLDNAERTVDALGGLPGQTLADDPARAAKQRGFEPQHALDTLAMSAMLNACRYWREHIGSDHPLTAKLLDAWATLRTDFPGDMPRYVEPCRRAVYGTADGRETHDPAQAKPGYRWTHTGKQGDTQALLLREQTASPAA